MCGRFSLTTPNDAVAAAMGAELELLADFAPCTANITPGRPVAVVRLNGAGARRVGMIRWGLIPHWTRGVPTHKPINARAETVATLGMFKAAFGRRRCLVPADGFYEWQRLLGGGKSKQKTRIDRYDGHVFAFAGLWERWVSGPGAAPLDTVVIITTEPNELMAPIHDRQPAVIDPSDYARWLARDTPAAEALSLLVPWSARGWRAAASP